MLKIPKSECPDIWIRLPRHKWPKSSSSMEDPVVLPERNLFGHLLAGLLWERQFEKILLKYGWEKVSNLECLFVHRQKGVVLICVCKWHQIGWKETKHWSDVESTQERSWIGRTNICILGMYSKTMWNKQRYCWQLQHHVWIQNFRRSNRKIAMFGQSSSFFMILRYGRSCQEMRGTMLWVGKQNDSTTPQSINSMRWWPSFQRRRNWNPWENCQQYALKLFWNVDTWDVLEDLILYGQWTNLHDRSQNGPKLVTNAWIDWFHIFIIRANTNSIAMWETLPNNADLNCFKTSTFAGDLENSKSTSGGALGVWEVIHLLQWVGCVRNKLQFRIVQQNRKSSLWMQDWAWMVSPHLIYGIWSSQFLVTRIRVNKKGETRLWTNVKFVQHFNTI